jgi:hypothetical protein
MGETRYILRHRALGSFRKFGAFQFRCLSRLWFIPELASRATRGRCYGHNFLRFLPIFDKKLAFFSKTIVMIKILHNLALSQKRQFFAFFSGENIFKIISPVPDWANFPPMGDCLV